jgi:hypothetical protein
MLQLLLRTSRVLRVSGLEEKLSKTGRNYGDYRAAGTTVNSLGIQPI